MAGIEGISGYGSYSGYSYGNVSISSRQGQELHEEFRKDAITLTKMLTKLD